MHQGSDEGQEGQRDTTVQPYSAIHYLLLPLLLVVAAATCCYYQLGYGRPNIHYLTLVSTSFLVSRGSVVVIEPEFKG